MWVSLRTEITMAKRAAGEQMNSVGARGKHIWDAVEDFRGHVAR